jgi:hypothetical protein
MKGNLSSMATSPIRTKRWTRLEYERPVDLGAFGPEDRIELVGEAAFGWRSTRIQHLSSGETVTPLGAPGARIAVADLLP